MAETMRWGLSSLSDRKCKAGELFSSLSCYKGDLLTSFSTQNPSPSARNVKFFTYFQYSELERCSTPVKVTMSILLKSLH